jgi:hypothetical protein
MKVAWRAYGAYPHLSPTLLLQGVSRYYANEMLTGAPFHWTEPATWPWMFYVWLAFALVGWAVPVWRWLQRKRASGWPTTDGRIESVEVTKPGFSFSTKRGYYVAELGYSYSVAGSLYSGTLKRDFPTEREADALSATLKGNPQQFTTTRTTLLALYCLNSGLQPCCRTARPQQRPGRLPTQIQSPTGSSLSSGFSSVSQPSVWFLAYG